MKTKLKTNNGITLIALIITIIIMLILVGVTVATTVNSGLFNKTKEATDSWTAAEVNESTIGNGPIEINGETYNSIDEYVEENITSSSPEEIDESITVTLTEENVGQYYGYKVASDTYDYAEATWRLFYVDFSNDFGDGNGTVYLKADSVMNSGLTNQTYDENIVKKFHKNITAITDTANVRSLERVTWLLDTNNWTTYYDSNKANYAVGAPSIEMYVKSYNQFISANSVKIGNGDELTDAKPLAYNCNGTGYYVGTTTGSGGYDSSCNTTPGAEKHSIVCVASNPDATDQLLAQIRMYNNDQMWLASPSASAEYKLLSAYALDGCVGDAAFGNYKYEVCPVVSLKSGTTVQLLPE